MVGGKFWTKYDNELFYWPNEWSTSKERFNALEKGCSDFDDTVYDSIFSFFIDNQPDLSLVYEDIYHLIRDYREDGQIINLIRDKYPEIYNYKGITMELQKELASLKKELADEKVKLAAFELAFKESCETTNQTLGVPIDKDSILYSDDGGAWQGYGTFETTTLPFIRTPHNYEASWVTRGASDEMEQRDINRNTVSNNEPLPEHELKGSSPIFDMLDVHPSGDCRSHGYGCDCAKQLYGELKPETVLNEDGTTSKKWTFDNKKLFQGLAQELLKVFDCETRSEVSEPKPSPEPTEVVYVLRIQPDSIVHAKMIEFTDDWMHAVELFGIEKHYVFE